MKIFLTLTIVLLIIFQAVGFTATQTFSASGEYTMSDYDTPEIAEEIALDFAKQNAAEQAGIYLESYSRMVNFKLADDEIKTVASSKIEVLTKNISRQSQSNGSILLRADITATVDSSELDDFIKQTREERQLAIQQYMELQRMNAKIKKDIDEFQAKLAAIKDETKDDDLIVEKERINREFLSKQKLDTGKPDEAIKINPRNGNAYTKRGLTTYSNGTFKESIRDFNRAIALEPEGGYYYSERGQFYGWYRHDYTHAVSDYNLAIRLGLDEESMRLTTFWLDHIWLIDIKDYSAGIENFTQIINLYPQNKWGYFYRAYIYEKTNDYTRAEKDRLKVTELAPQEVRGYTDLGEIYVKLGDKGKARKSYETALKVVEQNFKHDPNDLKNMQEYCYALNEVYGNLGKIGQPHKLLEKLDELIKLYPTCSFLYEYRGICNEHRKNYDLALKDYDTVLKLAATKEDKINAYKKRCYLYLYKIEFDKSNFTKEDYDKAEEEYQNIINLDPKDPKGYEDLYTWFKLYAKDKEKAAEVLNRLIEIDPNNPNHYEERANRYRWDLKDYDRAIKDYTQAIAINPDYSLAYYGLAETYAVKGDYDRALEVMDLIIKTFPKHSSAYSMRAGFYIEIKDYAHAIEDLNYVVSADPENYEVYYRRAKCYAAEEDWTHAAEDYTKTIELVPHHSSQKKDSAGLGITYSDYYAARAQAYENLGEYEKALADIDTAIGYLHDYDVFTKKQKLEYKAKILDARAEMYIQRGEYEKALADYDKAIEIHPWVVRENKRQELIYNMNEKNTVELNDIDDLMSRGNHYLEERNFDLAIKDYTRAIELDQNFEGLYYHRGLAYEELGEYEKALADFNRAVEIKPDALNIIKHRQALLSKMGNTVELDKESLLERGVSCLTEKNFDLSIKYCTQALELDPNYQNAYFVRASSYIFTEKSENVSLAFADLNKLLELNPRYNAEAYILRAAIYGELNEYKKALADIDKALEIDPNNELAKNTRQRVLDEMNK